MKIAIVIDTVFNNGGGITKAFIAFVSELTKNKDFEIHLYILGKIEIQSLINNENIHIFYPSRLGKIYFEKKQNDMRLSKKLLRYSMKVISLMSMQFLQYLIIRFSDEAEYNYDVGISYTNDIQTPKSYYFCNEYVEKKVKANIKMGWIHNDPNRLGFNRDYIEKRYANFDKIICVSKANEEALIKIAPNFAERITSIYNFIYSDNLNRFQPYENEKIHLISVGRLVPQKRFDRVLEVSKILKNNKIKFVWHIFGDGPDKDTLLQNAKSLHVDDVVQFEGYTDNVISEISKCFLFVMTSDYEGYSIVLIESLLAMTPIICTNFESSYESITNGVNGYIVDMNPQAIAEKIEFLINNNEVYQSLKKNIIENQPNNKKGLAQFYDIINYKNKTTERVKI